ncbi:helix-turn-helix domain-containing protein [Leuconostoc falkenbergense]|uniref:helix-turn-helix domain-containing protein n=1 Tax=Leuconostoc falkenbergense TaxID=2766470 RepID=UPI00293CE52B|nr:helix-turn-helix transcriptional regulator [Leuconostoc falkenbergense]MDV3546633.1 helix-turn-helix transcriptional regulator [Leuconostoc falkenbergense]
MAIMTDQILLELLRKRGEKRLSQKALADQIGISRLTLSKIERGETHLVQRRIFESILKFINEE